MRQKLLAFLGCVLLLTTSSLFAELVTDPSLASFRIASPGMGSTSFGSATAIAPRVVVTNAHVVGYRSGHRVAVQNPWGTRTWGKVFLQDSQADLAFIWTDVEVDHVELADGVVSREDSLVRYAYGPGNGRLVKVDCSFVTEQSLVSDRGLTKMILTGMSVSGDSGGGVFNSRGQLEAVLWGTNDRANTTSATSASQIVWAADYWDRNQRPSHWPVQFLRRIICPPGST